MYPSKKNIRYGIFVQNFENAVSDEFQIKKIVLTKKYGAFNKFLGYIKLYFKIVNLYFQSSKNKILYVHYPLHMAPVLLPLKYMGKNLILNFHGSDLIYDSVFKKFLSIWMKPLIMSCTIVVPSKYYKEKILSLYNRIKENNILIYPSGGVDKNIFYSENISNGSEFVIGFVSNLIEKKGWRVFLNAVKDISQNEIPNLKIIMVGDGPDYDEVKQTLQAIDIPFVLKNNLTQKELRSVYNQMSIFVFPSYREDESLGLVGLEAMACGIPVVASKTGGPMGYVKENYNGYLFEKQNVEELIQKLIIFYNSTNEEKQELKKNSLQTAAQYESSLVKKDLITFIHNTLGLTS